MLNEIIQLGEAWQFEKAVGLLAEEIKTDPENPELYYWLGRYMHYMVYDTRPFPGKSDQWSREKVLQNLRKAVALDPGHGDAKYFLAAEYGARALEAIKTGDANQYRKELMDAKSQGGFPLHAIEYGKNVLRSCDTNAILFANGDAEVNVIQYVQAIEGFRQDVSLVILALLERPYYIKLIRDGVPGILKPVPISMTDNLIMEMHNYKWKENNVLIPVSAQARKKYHLPDTITWFAWLVKPDMGNNKLWAGKAMVINIIEANQWERPVHFTLFGQSGQEELEAYIQCCGLSGKLFPIQLKGTEREYDEGRFTSLMLEPRYYTNYGDITGNNQPRVSYVFGNSARRRIVEYAFYLQSKGESARSGEVIKTMNALMPPEVFPLTEDIKHYLEILENARKQQLSEFFSKGKSIDEILLFIQNESKRDSNYDLSEIGLYTFARELMNGGKNQEALKVLELSITLYPEGYLVHDGYGECLMHFEQKEKAIQAYKKSLELNPGNTNAEKILKLHLERD